MTSQNFETYLPIYDTVPEKWEEARPFLVENLKKMSEAVNVRDVGSYLEEEVLTGKEFIPDSTNPQQKRSVFRKTINCGALIVGVNTRPHGINFTARFTLTDLWIAATDSGGLTAINMVYPELTMDAVNININSPGAYDKAFCVIEYLLEG